MKMINEDQIKSNLNVKQAIEEIRQTYIDCTNEKIYAGDRIFMPLSETDTLQILTANCKEKNYFGTKVSTVFPNNRSAGLPVTISKINLYSKETGVLESIVDANYLTAIKTGGSAAVATDLMAKKDAKVLAIIGTGLQAYSQVLAIQEVREIEELHIFDLISERVESFAKTIEEIQNHPYKIVTETSAQDCVKNADIICTCTASKTPVFDGNDLKAGAHVNAIGSFTSFMQEIDTTTVLKADKVVTEHVEGLWEAAGDILIPFNNGNITKDKVTGSLGDVLTDKVATRENDEEITLYESVGSGVLDVALAIMVYEKLLEEKA